MTVPWYQSRDGLQAEVDRHGSVAAAARANSVPRSTVASYAHEFGIRRRTPRKPLTDDTPSKHGVTYIIEAVGEQLYKIGRTTSPVEQRLRQLQTASPVPLQLVAVLDHDGWERVLHHHYRSKRRHGEWFALTTTDLRDLNAWC